jgi:hypothetical protein
MHAGAKIAVMTFTETVCSCATTDASKEDNEHYRESNLKPPYTYNELVVMGLIEMVARDDHVYGATLQVQFNGQTFFCFAALRFPAPSSVATSL